jgi:molybdenum cofactor biosynthesis enzyme MoaA
MINDNIGKDYLIFKRDKLVDSLKNSLSKRPNFKWTSLILAIASSTTSSLKCFYSQDNLYGYIFLSVAIPLFIWLLFDLIKLIRKNYFSVDEIIKNVISVENHEKNVLFIIKYLNEHNHFILFKKDEYWGYILPYVPLKNDNLVVELNSTFRGCEFKISPLYNDLEDTIKTNPKDNTINKHSFQFYNAELISPTYHFFELLKSPAFEQYEWKSYDELWESKKAATYNSDVINHLDKANLFCNSFSSFKELRSNLFIPSNLKVIWNITDLCQFKCEFCGTYRSKTADNLTYKDKLYIASELSKIKKIRIDFAGGDPLYDVESKEIIEHVSQFVIKNGISITATGKGMKDVDKNHLCSICKEFDISYDFPSTWSDVKHRQYDYNNYNFKYSEELSQYKVKQNILITLSNNNCNNIALDNMINELKQLKINSITLLRLMPVGKLLYSNYPKDKNVYNPQHAINYFKKSFPLKSIKLHCAFRSNIVNETNNYCNMLEEKIGVDHLGNVFACAWAGYLPIDIESNPFFIGNIVKECGIENVFKSKRYKLLEDKVKNSKNKNFCKIFSFCEKGEAGLFENYDMYNKWYN